MPGVVDDDDVYVLTMTDTLKTDPLVPLSTSDREPLSSLRVLHRGGLHLLCNGVIQNVDDGGHHTHIN